MAFPLACFENLHRRPEKVRAYLQEPSDALPYWFITDVFDSLQTLLYAFHELQVAQAVYAIERENAAEAALVLPTDPIDRKEEDEDEEFWEEGSVSRLFSGKRTLSHDLPPQQRLFNDKRSLSYNLPGSESPRTMISRRSSSFNVPSRSSSPRTVISRPTSSDCESSPATSITTMSPTTSPIMNLDYEKRIFDHYEKRLSIPPSTPQKNPSRKIISDCSMFPARRSSLLTNTKPLEVREESSPMKDPHSAHDNLDQGTLSKPACRSVSSLSNNSFFHSNLGHASPIPRFYIDTDTTNLDQSDTIAHKHCPGNNMSMEMRYPILSPFTSNTWTNATGQRQQTPAVKQIFGESEIFRQKFTQFQDNKIGLKRSTSTGTIRDVKMPDAPPVQNVKEDSFGFGQGGVRERNIELDSSQEKARSVLILAIPEQDMNISPAQNSAPVPQEGFKAFSYEHGYNTMERSPMTPTKNFGVIRRRTTLRRIASAAFGRTNTPSLWSAKKARHSLVSSSGSNGDDSGASNTSSRSESSLSYSAPVTAIWPHSFEHPTSGFDRPPSYITVLDGNEERRRSAMDVEKRSPLYVDRKALSVLGFASREEMEKEKRKVKKKLRVERLGEMVSEGLKMG